MMCYRRFFSWRGKIRHVRLLARDTLLLVSEDKMYKKFALILFSAAGALALGATAATAAWKPYGNTNPITSSTSTWKCNSSVTVTTNVISQVCTIRSASKTSVQGAIIVRNNKSTSYTTSASMDVYYENGNYAGRWTCSSSGVAANSWSVCFGTQFNPGSSRYYTGGYANTTWLGYSPSI